MSYIDDIFERLNIQHIREFLLHGVECLEMSPSTYEQRIEEAGDFAEDIIKMKFPEMEAYEKVMGGVHKYASAVEDVYMEIGMQCGAVLVAQLLYRNG